MKQMRFILSILFILSSFYGLAQKQVWRDYFSYNNVSQLSVGDDEVFGATENAILIFNTKTSSVETISSIQGLRVQKVTALHYSEKFKKLFVGNEDGTIQIVNRSNGKISFVDDIFNKNSLSPELKRINSFLEFKGELYVATNYGISVINLNNNEFLDTFFIGDQGGNEKVFQVAVVGNWIFAATEKSGLKRAEVNNPNLVDYKQWSVYDYSKWIGVCSVGEMLIGVKDDNAMYVLKLSGFESFGSLESDFKNIVRSKNHVTISSTSETKVYSLDLKFVGEIERSNIQSAVFLNDFVYIGVPDSGLLQFSLNNPNNPSHLTPEGPLNNRVFSLLSTENGMWMIFGGYSNSYNPHNPNLGSYGLSRYSGKRGWEHIGYDKLRGARALSKAKLHPRNQDQLFVSSFHSGLLQIDLNESDLSRSEVTLYDSENTGSNGLEKLDPILHEVDPDYVSVRVNGPAFDRDGTIWLTNSMVYNTLKQRMNNGDWNSYSFGNRLQDVEFSSFGVPLIDRNDTKWIPSYKDGLIGFNEKKGNKVLILNSNAISGNLPDNDVRSIAIDKNNQMWIGTYKGLRILSNPDRFLNDGQLQTNSIVIMQDGLAEELFYQQDISKIRVDGANNKWVAVVDAGVFLVSPNGQKTIYHFTKENSPLPNNIVNDIDINEKTGEVFFATDSGVVSFIGNATEGTSGYGNVIAYPNPVRPEFLGDVKITGLMDKSNVKIADVEGNLVFETTSQGGTVVWDTYSFSGRKVKSGVYLIFVSSQDGAEKTVKKLMIIR